MAEQKVSAKMITLPDYIASKLREPFEYGKNDCVLFTIGWVELATGKKYLPEKLWTSEKSALAAIKRRGSLIMAFDKLFRRIPPNYAQDGDIAVVGGVAMLFTGAQLVSVGKEGLLHKSRMLAEFAWTY